MSDSEEENYAKYGCALDPLDEDNLPRKKPVGIQDQIAVDEYGRRRFHGAFTGGFSAGYFNSVGTKDGWQPQQFKSSRKKKFEGITQRPEDFMDEEDTSEFGIAPTRIGVTLDYVDAKQRGTKRKMARHINDGPIPGTPVLENVIKPVKDRIGVKLLKKMGWKPGQGIGPRLTKREKANVKKQNEKVKVYTCYMPTQKKQYETSDSESSDDEYSEIKFAPDDYEPFRINPKDNFFGIGYTGLDKRPVLSGHINLFEPQTFCLEEKNKKFSVTGQAFGVGAFEAEDEDIYAREDMSNYDFELGPSKKLNSKSSQSKVVTFMRNGCFESFLLAKNSLPRRKFFEPPDLPKDFKAVHVIRKSRFNPPIESPPRNVTKKYGGQHLNAEARGAIIGEPSLSRNSQESGESNNKSHNKEQSNKIDCVSSLAAKIITKTLNLHGREQVAERQKLEKEREIAAASSSWLDKLYSSSFVKGGTMGPGLNVDGSLQNLEQYQESNKSESLNKLDSPVESKSSMNLFITNPDKQQRFEKYLDLRKHKETHKLDGIQPFTMSEWGRNQEKTEFEQAARLLDSKNIQNSSMEGKKNSVVKKFVTNPSIFSEPEGITNQMKEAAKMKMFGKLTRERIIWQPSSLVCKRFNVAEPNVGCAMDTEKKKKKKKFSVFESLDFCGGASKFQTSTILEKEINYEPQSPSLKEKKFDEIITEETTEIDKNFEASYEKVFGKGEQFSMIYDSKSEPSFEEAKEKIQEKRDLFKAIFLSSSEDSDSDPEKSVDSEIVKSVLIGQPGEINIQRNTSPPRGIFANLDFDSLVGPSTSQSDKNKNEASATRQVSPDVIEVTCKVIPFSSSRDLEKSKNITENRDSLQSSRSFFKSVDDTSSDIFRDNKKKVKDIGKRTKVKKSKKEKKKHKHKDKERYKHKKSKKEKKSKH
ncbi:G patch domain-containing protein 1 homolog [Leptopilina boulardi]|uniref:G patch domain-containing protein 1 homolog n=1 Tax=Leptopilina boulardi TaxID=63433 RepID=UPI0021F61EE8|nr:G patch domain-containing protein 1 homolog [Leptopilina boulardi]